MYCPPDDFGVNSINYSDTYSTGINVLTGDLVNPPRYICNVNTNVDQRFCSDSFYMGVVNQSLDGQSAIFMNVVLQADQIATSTGFLASNVDIVFGLGIIITVLMFILVGFIWNSIKFKKPWR